MSGRTTEQRSIMRRIVTAIAVAGRLVVSPDGSVASAAEQAPDSSDVVLVLD